MPLACPLTMPSVQHATWAMTRFPPIRQLRTTDTTQSAQRRRKLSSTERRYAEAHYHLPLTTADGVCSVVHSVDLAGFQLPSIRALVDDVIARARRDRSMAETVPATGPSDRPAGAYRSVSQAAGVGLGRGVGGPTVDCPRQPWSHMPPRLPCPHRRHMWAKGPSSRSRRVAGAFAD